MMRYIKLEGRTPADSDIPGWTPWPQEDWKAWLEKSTQLREKLTDLNSQGRIEERNTLIDDNSAHWGKLKNWLSALSNGKCWFSEVRELYSHYDVEHFRPKKEAKSKDGTIRDGYWWLAFEFTNFRLCGNVGNRKKGGWFPLSENSLCSTFESQCEESETPFLLDPTDPEDVTLIAFNEEGNAIAAPDIVKSEWEKMRVEETINRLKLNSHEPLTEARKKIWFEINREMDLFLTAKSKCQVNNSALKEKMKKHLENIKTMTDQNSVLSSVARWCVQFRNDPQIMRVMA